MLISVIFLCFLLPTSLEAFSSLDFIFPFTFEYVQQNLGSWFPAVQVRIGTGILFNGMWLRFKRALEKGRGKTDMGMHVGSHCAYVGPDRGISLVDISTVKSLDSSRKAAVPILISSANWQACEELCSSRKSCTYWNLDYKGVCTLKTIDYPTAEGQLSGYCTKGGNRKCSYGGKGLGFVKYNKKITSTSGGCMDECLMDVEKCTNWNWTESKRLCLLYYVAYGSTTAQWLVDVNSGTCI